MHESMYRPSRPVAALCIAVIVLAAFLPGMSAAECALFEPRWVLLPEEVVTPVYTPVVLCDEQPSALLALDATRGPPAPPLA